MERPGPRPTPLRRIVISAALTAAYTAVPDYATTRRQQRLARIGLTVSALGLGAFAFARADPEDAQRDESEQPPRTTTEHAAVLAAVVPLSVASYRATRRVDRALVERLQSRGVRLPWTWVGLGWAAIRMGLELLERGAGAD